MFSGSACNCLVVLFSKYKKWWLVNMLLHTYFHDHKLTTTDVCTTLLQHVWRGQHQHHCSPLSPSRGFYSHLHTLCINSLCTKFRNMKCKKFAAMICKEPWKMKFHPRHVFALLTSSAGPVCLLNTLLYNSLLCNVCLCLGPDMYVTVGNVHFYLTFTWRSHLWV